MFCKLYLAQDHHRSVKKVGDYLSEDAMQENGAATMVQEGKMFHVPKDLFQVGWLQLPSP